MFNKEASVDRACSFARRVARRPKSC